MGRCGYLAWSKRKLKRGTAGTCLVTHITLEADSPFMQSPNKVSRIFDASTVSMMSINKRVNTAHHHDPILEASQEHLGDKVM